MITDSGSAADCSATCPEDLRADLTARVRHRTSAVIDAELQRLAGRVRTLDRTDLDVIDAALQEIAESLILTRLRDVPEERVPLLWQMLCTGAGDR